MLLQPTTPAAGSGPQGASHPLVHSGGVSIESGLLLPMKDLGHVRKALVLVPSVRHSREDIAGVCGSRTSPPPHPYTHTLGTLQSPSLKLGQGCIHQPPSDLPSHLQPFPPFLPLKCPPWGLYPLLPPCLSWIQDGMGLPRSPGVPLTCSTPARRISTSSTWALPRCPTRCTGSR